MTTDVTVSVLAGWLRFASATVAMNVAPSPPHDRLPPMASEVAPGEVDEIPSPCTHETSSPQFQPTGGSVHTLVTLATIGAAWLAHGAVRMSFVVSSCSW